MTVRGQIPASASVPPKRGVPVTRLIEPSVAPRFYPNSEL